MEIIKKAEIEKLISENRIVLFLKGTKNTPYCGFSATVVQILKNLKVDFVDIDILQDQQMRHDIKLYSDWPTIPQLYIDGIFIGGCDITKTMFQNGELQKLINSKE